MKTASTSQLAFKPHVLIGFALYAIGLALTLAPMSSAVAGNSASTELNPSAPAHAPGRWTATGSMVTARYIHLSALLLNGQVLVVGGADGNNDALASAELYQPETGVWTPTGSMAAARDGHTATLLPNGQVLVAGGDSNGSPSAELYDPATGVWTATGSMAIARQYHTATLLPNGQVLVAAGQYTGSAELYDPATGVWTATKSLGRSRLGHAATLLLNGEVLVSGGYSRFGVLARAQLYKSAPEGDIQ